MQDSTKTQQRVDKARAAGAATKQTAVNSAKSKPAFMIYGAVIVALLRNPECSSTLEGLLTFLPLF